MAITTLNTKLDNKRLTILFVGSNPSNASASVAAFHMQTKSSKTLNSWCEALDGNFMHLNVLNEKTEGNRPLNKKEIKLNIKRLSQDIANIKPDKIIALGKTAATALGELGEYFYEMPHPSGRNRLLNDASYVAEKVKGLIEFCNSTRPST